MTENQKQLKIAFRKAGGYKVMETWSGDIAYSDPKNLIENKQFQAELRYSGFSRGRSSLNIEWTDDRNKIIYYSGMSLLDKALKDGRINGDKLKSDFCFKKQGTAILLEEV